MLYNETSDEANEILFDPALVEASELAVTSISMADLTEELRQQQVRTIS